jgi:hypothetical protein
MIIVIIRAVLFIVIFLCGLVFFIQESETGDSPDFWPSALILGLFASMLLLLTFQ